MIPKHLVIILNDNRKLFVNQDYDLGHLNDLWKYNVSSYQWTWISGSSIANQTGVYGTKGIPSYLNYPGARVYSLSWIDSKDTLWLFGGDQPSYPCMLDSIICLSFFNNHIVFKILMIFGNIISHQINGLG
jgi:hypothetical protein